MPQQSVRVADQSVDQQVAGVLVVPGDRRLTRIVVIVGGAMLFDHRRGGGNLAAHPPDRGDQLSHGVLRGDRII
ncbi:hypothetical protein MAGR_17090 [Mycolicibacterium agri]|uniref:Uncharacterized protein n=1 Tax=Mycolicibacterium agri TaxID=36811 RepID=A0A7I9VZ01_MYCAG|nr:hypothetical protein MAGR_17090 [Mycolicibacterium agri]